MPAPQAALLAGPSHAHRNHPLRIAFEGFIDVIGGLIATGAIPYPRRYRTLGVADALFENVWAPRRMPGSHIGGTSEKRKGPKPEPTSSLFAQGVIRNQERMSIQDEEPGTATGAAPGSLPASLIVEGNLRGIWMRGGCEASMERRDVARLGGCRHLRLVVCRLDH